MEHIFGGHHGMVYPLVCGIETDDEALVIHGNNNAVLDLAGFSESDAATLEPCLADLLPDMSVQMRADLLPLLHGNLEHIAQVREQARRHERVLDVEHREWMICLGRGFDFLHTPNIALIIGPYSPDLADPLRKAAGIIENNMNAGRIPDDGFLLLASAPYDEIGVDRARGRIEVQFSFALRSRRAEERVRRTGRKNVYPYGRAGLALAQPRADRSGVEKEVSGRRRYQEGENMTYAEIVRFHGHECPGIAIGYRMATAAMARLSTIRAADEELVAIVENDACGVDAVQCLTGCTFGKGNLLFRDYGKQVYTIYARSSRQGVRVVFHGKGIPEDVQRDRGGADTLDFVRFHGSDPQCGPGIDCRAGTGQDPRVRRLRLLRGTCHGVPYPAIGRKAGLHSVS